MPITLFATLGKAYRFLWDERRDLFAYAFLPVLLVSFIQIAGLWLTGDWQLFFEALSATPESAHTPHRPLDPREIPAADIAAMVANAIAAFAAYAMFAVAWFRRYLIGPESTTVGAAMRWGQRQWRFVARFFMLIFVVLLLGVLATLPLSLFTNANPILDMFARTAIVIASLLVTARLLLILPAAALDHNLGIRDAANATAGKSWYMVGLYLFSLLPMLFALIIIGQIIAGLAIGLGGPSLSFMFVALLLQQSIMFVAIAAQVTALAEAYRQLVLPPA
ncbi:MAG: hypothetical protein CMM26_05770 [Rhodospirillaceae bacterium]|nr:hypothetical protein [Rhodospirillaceae bacterium]